MGWSSFQLFHVGKITRNYYTHDLLSCNIGNYLSNRQSERYMMIKNIQQRMESTDIFHPF